MELFTASGMRFFVFISVSQPSYKTFLPRILHDPKPTFGLVGLFYLSFLLADICYIFGGSTEPDDEGGVSYEVITVNLKRGDVGQASDTPYPTN